jgi:hypothetical protein
MRLAAVSAIAFAVVFLGAATTAFADTHAPSTQHVTMTCGSATYDAVSPTDAAHGGQVVGSNVAIVALNTTVTDATTGEVLFQSRPTGSQNPQGQSCWFPIDGVIVTIWAIVTPRNV